MSSPVQWTGAKDNMWKPTGETTKDLPPGHYSAMEIDSMFGTDRFLVKQTPKHDKAIIVTDSISTYIIDSIKRFKAAKENYKRFNQLHKRGILLEGPPGSGKSMSAMLASEWHVEQGGVVIYPSHPAHFKAMPAVLDSIRQIHPEMDILCILEDVDHPYYTEYEENLLSLLDGQFQIGNVFYILTTNHLEEVSERLTNRPKRIDDIKHVGPPTAAARRSYLDQLVPTDQPMRAEAIVAMVNVSDGLMLAHLSELMVGYLVLDHPLEEVATRLKKMLLPENDDEMIGTDGVPPIISLQISKDDLQRATRKAKRRR